MLLCNSLGIGGTERVVEILASFLPKEMFEITVVGFASGGVRCDYLRSIGIRVVICGGNSRQLASVVQKEKLDILHIHRPGCRDERMTKALSNISGITLVETNVFGIFDESILGKMIDMRVLVSHSCRDRYLNWSGCDGNGSVVVYNPVDVYGLQENSTKRRDSFRQKFNIPREIRLIGFAAQPSRWSHKLVKRCIVPYVSCLKKLCTNFKIVCIGVPDTLKKLITSDPLMCRNVMPLPALTLFDEIAEFYNGVDIYAHLATLGESCSCVVEEAMACGKPVVARYVPWALNNAQCELVDNGKTGYVVSGSISKMAYASAKILESEHRIEEMGKAAFEKACTEFDVSVTIKKYIACYLQALKAKGKATHNWDAKSQYGKIAKELINQDPSEYSSLTKRNIDDCIDGCLLAKRLAIIARYYKLPNQIIAFLKRLLLLSR